MQVTDSKVVSFEYTLLDTEGNRIDSSEGRAPLSYLHGKANIIPGLERALDGRSVGDELEVVVSPEDGYGPRREQLVRNLPVRKLPNGRAQVGMRFQAQTDRGPREVVVTKLRGDYATVDANHPLAGKTLQFKLKIVEVRDATEEELAHGHVHGPGGHDH